MTYTQTFAEKQLTPLLQERDYHILRAGYGFRGGSNIEEDRQHQPITYRSVYKPFSLYEENPHNIAVKGFIGSGNIYYPKDDDWDTYICLLGGSLPDISFVLDRYCDKQFIINETEPHVFQIYQSLRDYPNETISVYEKCVASLSSVTDNYTANQHYLRIKKLYLKGYGKQTSAYNSGVLLFLLHTGGLYTDFIGKAGISFYQQRIRALWQWHKALSSDNIRLFHTDYRNIPLPTGKAFVVATCPSFYHRVSFSPHLWTGKDTIAFASFYNFLQQTTDYYLLASSNTNPSFRRVFRAIDGWHTTICEDKTLTEYEWEDAMKRNLYHTLFTNYPIEGIPNKLTPSNTFHTKEFLTAYLSYCRNLL